MQKKIWLPSLSLRLIRMILLLFSFLFPLACADFIQISIPNSPAVLCLEKSNDELIVNSCDDFKPNQRFNYTATGQIQLLGKEDLCLELLNKDTGKLGFRKCDSKSEYQKWKNEGGKFWTIKERILDYPFMGRSLYTWHDPHRGWNQQFVFKKDPFSSSVWTIEHLRERLEFLKSEFSARYSLWNNEKYHLDYKMSELEDDLESKRTKIVEIGLALDQAKSQFEQSQNESLEWQRLKNQSLLDYEEKQRSLNESHQSELNKLKLSHEAEIAELRTRHNQSLLDHEEKQRNLNESHHSDLNQLKRSHEAELSGLSTRLDQSLLEQEEKRKNLNESLQAELSQLQFRMNQSACLHDDEKAQLNETIRRISDEKDRLTDELAKEKTPDDDSAKVFFTRDMIIIFSVSGAALILLLSLIIFVVRNGRKRASSSSPPIKSYSQSINSIIKSDQGRIGGIDYDFMERACRDISF